MSLEVYLSNIWIRKHESSVAEIANLFAIADRDITKSQTPGLGPEWGFDIAYNSALQSATAALAASGYKAERQNKHMRTIECLAFTLGWNDKDIAFFDACRRKRHTAVGAISDQEASEMIQLATRLRQQVEDWIRREHDDLLP